jgi:predicted RNase H-like nuclease
MSCGKQVLEELEACSGHWFVIKSTHEAFCSWNEEQYLKYVCVLHVLYNAVDEMQRTNTASTKSIPHRNIA